jgi:phosphoenolpyruvate carboxykinase (ATP)
MASPSVASLAASPAADPDLGALGLRRLGKVFYGLPPARLVESALARGEGILTDSGALVAYTGAITGRSPKDRWVVAEAARPDEIWWGPVNRAMPVPVFDRLFDRVAAYLQGRDLFVLDASACADPRCALPVRVVADKAWHALFSQCLLRPPVEDAVPELTIVCASGMHADPGVDGTRTGTFIVLNLERRLVLIGGTEYAGEIKKAVFSVLNYLLPLRGVFPMHCSANVGPGGDAALFFGLSGTGKTTLSADPERRLIGDDEHGWSGEGVFNIEGGCYAKCIRLSEAGEPQIYRALRFGSVLENVPTDEQGRPDFDDDRITENTRAAYPLSYIDGAVPSGTAGHPRTVIFLTCDAFGVLPPVSRLSVEQAMYHFLSGYTAKVAGTEAGVTEPEATFSTCFAAPFLPLHPARYADLLADRLRTHGSSTWLVNTGWTGGPNAGGGRRVPLALTRAMVRAILDGSLDAVPTTPDEVFGVAVPVGCPGVPAEILRPRQTWSDPSAYDEQARQLVARFVENIAKYATQVSEAVRRAGPRVG